MAAFCEHGNESHHYIQGKTILRSFSNCQIFKKDLEVTYE
jgi:hypothetical protein